MFATITEICSVARMWETTGLIPRSIEVTVDGYDLVGQDPRQVFRHYKAQAMHDGSRLDANWEDRVWQAMHDKYPRYVLKTDTPKEVGLSVATATAYIHFLIKTIKGIRYVSREEAHRRASICRQCPMKRDILGCGICKAALKRIVKQEPVDGCPAGCGACGCYMPLKVWVVREQLGDANAFPYWEGCWMKELPEHSLPDPELVSVHEFPVEVVKPPGVI